MVLANMFNVKKYYYDRLVLNIDRFEIYENEKIGIVGANGAGKTTLLKALTNKIKVNEGKIYLTDSYSYIAQNEDFNVISKNCKIKSILNATDKYEDYLSGGEKVKLRITNALAQEKKLIIADEPTTNLDKNSISILKELLLKHTGALLLISHDRELLNELCTKIIEIEDGKLKCYNGNYENYLNLKEKERIRQQFEYDNYIAEKNRLIIAKEKQFVASAKTRKAPKRMGNSEARLHKMGDQRGKKNLDSSMKSIEKRISKLDKKEKPKEINEIKIYIRDDMEIVGKNLVEINNFTLLIKDNVLLKNISFNIGRNKKVALLGDNGCGKTTLVKEIIKNNNSAIRINPKVKIGYFDQNQNILHESKSIIENIKNSSSFDETFIRTSLNLFGFKGDFVYNPINVLSGGEKVKVALCKILLEDNNFIILDEPTNYLDVSSIGALEKSLNNTNKTMLIVSHDSTFISSVCDYIIEIKDKQIIEFNGSYNAYLNSRIDKVYNKNEELLLLENKMNYIISMLCIETNSVKKEAYEKEYELMLSKLKNIKG